jgi:dephospho-CoA kinase
MRIVGLTGGIASGKSTVSNLFKANDIPVIDADLVARDVLKKGTSGWKKLFRHLEMTFCNQMEKLIGLN